MATNMKGINKRNLFFLRDQLISNLVKKSDRNGILNISRISTLNQGDLLSAPSNYYPSINDKNIQKIDILGDSTFSLKENFERVSMIKNNDLIIGGGGLLDRKTFQNSISFLADFGKYGNKTILWGVGHNNVAFKPSKLFYDQVSKFNLVGIRDKEYKLIKGAYWVPCSSCLNNSFEEIFQPKRELGIISHEHIEINLKGIKQSFDQISNDTHFGELVQFIGESEVILTNSYHAMYWSVLMKKKVVVIPNSSKMFSFKYDVPIINSIEELSKGIKKSSIYSEALEECRDANHRFYLRVKDYLS